eukprot:1703467-Amphidinium_carterae.1
MLTVDAILSHLGASDASKLWVKTCAPQSSIHNLFSKGRMSESGKMSDPADRVGRSTQATKATAVA